MSTQIFGTHSKIKGALSFRYIPVQAKRRLPIKASKHERLFESPILRESWNLGLLISGIEYKWLRLAQDYQRNYRMPAEDASVLIVSSLQNIPVQDIFVHEVTPDTFEVIDGKQRLVSWYCFVTGDPQCLFPDVEFRELDLDNAPVSLVPKEEYLIYHGKKYSDLDKEDQEHLMKLKVGVRLLPLGTSVSNVARVFESISQRTDHSPQEWRRSALWGSTAQSIAKLAAEKNEMLESLTLRDDGSFILEELVLRSYALRDALKKKDKDVKLFIKADVEQLLNSYLINNRELPSETLLEMANVFAASLDLASSVFEERAFRRAAKARSSLTFDVSQFDTVMLVLGRICSERLEKNTMEQLTSWLRENKSAVKAAHIEVLESYDYHDVARKLHTPKYRIELYEKALLHVLPPS